MTGRPAGAFVALLVLAAAVCSACGRGTSTDHAGSGDSTHAATAPDTTFRRGIARVAGTQLFFAACDGPPEAPLADRTGGALTEAVRGLAGDGAQKVYVEFGGRDASGGLEADVFLRAAPDGEGGGCGRPVGTFLFQAFGNEPFWSATVWEDSLVFAQPGDPSHVLWPSTAVRATRDPAGTRTW